MCPTVRLKQHQKKQTDKKDKNFLVRKKVFSFSNAKCQEKLSPSYEGEESTPVLDEKK